ncbi:mechanosensitive ion channel protein [Leptospira congkakensis]|uniref:Mechanosensitive ion channel protein n=1 Tax=Leptospira congkakensis TaxID=2484932 RepID=A0A4Z1AES7_9LEPT|nr:mechanosensitive ion channel domain-containing protein [Leptospira congkakensis]TGL88586.1 mechanosensitive ion channel protein [Leptospira congkakensis]TGL89172.1 mechanosensitive ion channel protein [Leptospira congkakensis]TGL97139.1 mechanosensitive ion channel protein [Leptospira congkakensis]
MGGSSLREFYWDLNPLTLLVRSNRDFAETMILFGYMVVFAVFSYKITMILVERIKPAPDAVHEYNRRKVARMGFLLIFGIAYLPIVFSSLSLLPTVLGLAGAGIVISLKEVWLNMVGWFMIMGGNGFKVGDRIELDNIKGDVVNIGFFKFTLLEIASDPRFEQSTNRLIHFPNYNIVLHRFFIVSETMDFVWDEFKVYLDISSNWEKAEKICSQILHEELVLAPELVESKIREMSKNYLVRLGKTTPIVYTSLEPEGTILMCLRYLTPIRSKRLNRILISKEILTKFKNENDIHIYTH